MFMFMFNKNRTNKSSNEGDKSPQDLKRFNISTYFVTNNVNIKS